MSYATIETELAWAAGFFDGEGGTCLSTTGRRFPEPKVSVNQVDRRPLDRFARAVGVGNVRGPYPNGPNAQPIYEWSVSKIASIAQVLRALWPHLSEPKREQAYARLEEWYNARARAGHWTNATHCANGHDLTAENRGPRTAKGFIPCRRCIRERVASRAAA